MVEVKKIALAVASSGIASQLLLGARTGHSLFKLPININVNSICSIKLQASKAVITEY